MTLVAILRSGMHVPGISPDGEWPPCAKRLGKLAWAFAYRMRKAGSSGPSHLADDDVMLLCQGAEVLEAVAECSGSFFCGHEKREVFADTTGGKHKGFGVVGEGFNTGPVSWSAYHSSRCTAGDYLCCCYQYMDVQLFSAFSHCVGARVIIPSPSSCSRAES